LDPSQKFASPQLSCPTCALAFHGQSQCRRCGTDLSLLMKTAALAWEVRDRARRCLLEREFEKAIQLARKAQAIHKSPFGELLEQLASRGIEAR
jgi:hypothetical protein